MWLDKYQWEFRVWSLRTLFKIKVYKQQQKNQPNTLNQQSQIFDCHTNYLPRDNNFNIFWAKGLCSVYRLWSSAQLAIGP